MVNPHFKFHSRVAVEFQLNQSLTFLTS